MMSYNGWVNYPTWAVHLWISNEEVLWDTALALAEDERAYWSSFPWHGPDSLREWVQNELVPEVDGMAGDILTWGLAQVDWLEVYDAIVDALPEVDHEAE
jgi:hypothetical protein